MSDESRMIGERLKLLRETLRPDMTAAAFARFMGLTEQALNNYEKGRRRIHLDEALKIVRKTGVSLDWIYQGIPHTLADQRLSGATPSQSQRGVGN